MKSDYVISAFRAFLRGQHEEGIRLVKMIEACERANGRNTVARQLANLLGSHPGQLMRLEGAPAQMALAMPERTLGSLILDASVQKAIAEIVREWQHRDKLTEANLPLRNVLLFCGPSGNGKTSVAEALATALELPLGLVAYDQLIDSHLGDSEKNLSQIFTFVARMPCVVFFDEADSIGTARGTSESAANRCMNGMVNQLLIKLDGLRSDCMVVFCTNRESELDVALKRRIHTTLTLNAPGEVERRQMYELCYRKWPMLRFGWEGEADKSARSFAAIEQIAMQAARRIVLEAVA